MSDKNVTPAPSRGFTIIEMLVVTSIIALLVSILLPTLGHARGQSRALVCRTHLRGIGQGMLLFTQDHNRTLPGVHWSAGYSGSADWQRTWVGDEAAPGYIPHEGVIVDYVGGREAAADLVRCPAQRVIDAVGSGRGSNGMFDYSMIQSFNGAKLGAIDPDATVVEPNSLEEIRVLTPLVVEEDPANHINGVFVDPAHTSINRLARTHPGGTGQYVAIDGSVHGIRAKNQLGPQAQQWKTRAPSGVIIPLSGTGNAFGAWMQE